MPTASPPTTAWIGKVNQPTSAAHQYTSPGSYPACQCALAQVPSRNPPTLCTTPFGRDSVPEVKIRNDGAFGSSGTRRPARTGRHTSS